MTTNGKILTAVVIVGGLIGAHALYKRHQLATINPPANEPANGADGWQGDWNHANGGADGLYANAEGKGAAHLAGECYCPKSGLYDKVCCPTTTKANALSFHPNNVNVARVSMR